MKKIFILLILLLSSIVQADMEHKLGQGALPSPQKLSIARGCFKEIDEQGCGHPKENHEFFISCLEVKGNNLSSNCITFFNRLYGKRN
jgi:hypothetical protein